MTRFARNPRPAPVAPGTPAIFQQADLVARRALAQFAWSRQVVRNAWSSRAFARLFGATALSALAGCSSIGPATVNRDRFDYVCAISDSWKRQMLQNLLKVRYADAPVFLDVTSIISAYTLSGQANVFGQQSPINERGETFAGANANVAYVDRPTISYAPLSGEKFSRSMMSPLPISGILYLLQSGYPADVVLRICAHSINGLDNSFGGNFSGVKGDPRFAELMTLMRRSQIEGGLGISQRTPMDRESAVLYLRSTSAAGREANGRIRELLGVSSGEEYCEVTFGTFRASANKIALHSRSTLQVMTDFASYINVPAAEIAERRVYQPERTVEDEQLFEPLIRIHSGEKAPGDAYVTLPYRGRHFWIDDHDVASKSAMSFLMLLFSLAETGTAPNAAPQLTIPAR